jgi:NAD+ synthase
MTTAASASTDLLGIDATAETDRIASSIRDTVLQTFRRRGVVVGVSGGIDSAVVASLCARALGEDRVLLLLMPEADSSKDSLRLGQQLAESLKARFVVEDITSILTAAGCYKRRDAAIREVFPVYGEGYKSKLILPNVLEAERYRVFSIVVQPPVGESKRVRLSASAYLGIVAATNFKQRVRKMMEYYYADLLNYAVAGTPNRLEYDQGFFVKLGDGAADLKPIAHLYKSQVYQLAAYLGLPEEIRHRPSTTDTYSLEQTQEEFFFALPLRTLDLCLYGKNNAIAPSDLAPIADISPEQVERAYRMIESKRRATQYLHSPAFVVEPIKEV